VKRCSACKKVKPKSEFYKDKSKSDGLTMYCKECKKAGSTKSYAIHRKKIKEKQREYRKAHPEKGVELGRKWQKAHPEKVAAIQRKTVLKCRYGLTIEKYNRMFKVQGGVCAICGEPERRRKRSRLSVDHDHITGQIRELLCSRCNFIIGAAEENLLLLRKVIAYLTKHSRKKKVHKEAR